MSYTPIVIDLETTGLHPANDHILEIAAVTIDDALNETGSYTSVIHASPKQLTRMNEYVTAMHISNGLLPEVREATKSLADVDAQIYGFLTARGITEKSAIIMGSSCRLDLYMIELQMPKLASLLTHRMIDVSGVREAIALYSPEVSFEQPFELLLDKDPVVAHTPHRALSDSRWTLHEAQLQRQLIRASDLAYLR